MEYQNLVADYARLWRTELSLVKIYQQQEDLSKAEPYWIEAVKWLFDYRYIEQVDDINKKAQIYAYLELFIAKYEELADREKENQMRRLRVEYGSRLALNVNEQTRSYIKDGEALMKTGDWETAQRAFRQAISSLPVSAHLEIATINERMGDLCSRMEEEAFEELRWAESDNAPYDQAARHYEIAIEEYVQGEDIRSAERALEKLFTHLSPEEIGLEYAVEAYLRVLESPAGVDFGIC